MLSSSARLRLAHPRRSRCAFSRLYYASYHVIGGAAPQAPDEPACEEDEELKRWRAELATKQAKHDAKRAALTERPISDPPKTCEGICRSSGHVMGRMRNMKKVRPKPAGTGIVVDTSPDQ